MQDAQSAGFSAGGKLPCPAFAEVVWAVLSLLYIYNKYNKKQGRSTTVLALSVKACRLCQIPLFVAYAPSSPRRGGSLSSKWEPLAVHADFISLPRPLPLGEVDANVASRRRGRGCCPCAMCLFPSPLLQFVQLRQLFVKKFHLRGGENRRRERGRAAFESKEFFIGNTEKSSCKLTTKGV